MRRTQRARRKPTESLDAYDLYMRALSEIRDPSREALHAAIGLSRRATELDPSFAAALALHATALQMLVTSGWAGVEVQPEALRLARAAMDNAGDDAEILAEGANVFAYMLGDIEISLSALSRALQLNGNSLLVLRHSGWVNLWAGHTEAAIGHLSHALRLSPRDPGAATVRQVSRSATALPDDQMKRWRGDGGRFFPCRATSPATGSRRRRWSILAGLRRRGSLSARR